MKKINYIFALVAAAVTVFSCSKIAEERSSDGLIKVSFMAGRPEAQQSAPASKTDISSTGAVTWNASDHLAVFTDVDGSTAYDFSIAVADAGKATAQFSGSVASNPSRTYAYAVYPYSDSWSGGPAALAVSVPAVQADGENYTLMAGNAAVAGDDFSAASVSMKHLCWLYDINITNSSSKAIKAVHFSAGSAVFATAGTVDLTADSPAVSAGAKVKDVSVEFASAVSSDVTARFALLPLSCTDVDFNIHVVFEDGFYETFAIGSKSLDIAAGKRKCNTFVLGNGTVSQAPWGWYFVAKGTNLGTAIFNARNSSGTGEARMWLESSPTESYTYATSSILKLRKSVWIDSDPANMNPSITQGATALFYPYKNSIIETISIRNVNLMPKADLNESYIFRINSADSTGVHVGDIVFENCSFTAYKNCVVRLQASDSKIETITFNNCIYQAHANFSTGYALLHLPNNGNRLDALTIKNSTFGVVACLMYLNLNSTNQVNPLSITMENSTFANWKASSNKYMFNIQNAIGGITSIKDNLFVGSNANTGVTFGMIKEGAPAKFTNIFSNNWYTSDWLTFTVNTSSGYQNYLTNQSTLLNSALCPNYASSDFTVAAGSDVRAAGAGDPRWLK